MLKNFLSSGVSKMASGSRDDGGEERFLDTAVVDGAVLGEEAENESDESLRGGGQTSCRPETGANRQHSIHMILRFPKTPPQLSPQPQCPWCISDWTTRWSIRSSDRQRWHCRGGCVEAP